ncbi:stage II sporulation protein M [Paenibacillus filicis]|uniref:Stage II sporulation protein M n=1 Tax=Paenibacillus gyeongsangnamensis TaxID=3388067 RepID=A0ABT4QKA0_9BACL|nr:stage II sporulation protein M [Paenibacillus filicis]MCZ8517299.1 stage II sporulation protein M [Paenibacillus filicis]
MNWKLASAQIRIMKHYFIASSLVFLVGLVLGAGFSDHFQSFLASQVQALQEITKKIPDVPNQQWQLFWLIFWNNTSKSLLIIVLGVFFGVFPLFFLMANGMILGYIAVLSAQKASWLFVAKTILPHGIIEIPAVVIACAFGIRFGLLVIKTLFSMLSPARSVKAFEELRTFMKSLVPVGLSLVLLLFVAALIESTLTFWLAKA